MDRQRLMVEAAAKKAGSYGELAKALGVSRQALWFWRAGKREAKPEAWAKLCNFVGSDLEQLTGGSNVDGVAG